MVFQNWNEIIGYARLCPSVHNIQPWKLKIKSETSADLFYDVSRLIPATDPTSALTVMSLAMFVESLSIAANPLGYQIKATFVGEGPLSTSCGSLCLFATLILEKTAEAEKLPRELLLQRKTSRLRYNGKSLEQQSADTLTELCKEFGHSLRLSTEASTVNAIIRLHTQTFFHELDNNSARMEFATWMRTSRKDAQSKKDGLSNECLGLSALVMNGMAYRPALFKSFLLKPLISAAYTGSMKGTPAIGCLTGRFSTREDWIQAGRLLLRFWLQVRTCQAVIHPLMSLTFNSEIFQQFKALIQHSDAEDSIWFVFRIGYSEEPPASYRLETKDITD
jgi:hypothetical protein